MGLGLDMTRTFAVNRAHIEKTHAKRQLMRHLYMKGLEANNYSYYQDNIPPRVVEEVKKQIRENFHIIRMKIWLKTFAGFLLLLGLMFVLFYVLIVL